MKHIIRRFRFVLVGKLPNAHLGVIANAGHLPHEEKPMMFMETDPNFQWKT